ARENARLQAEMEAQRLAKERAQLRAYFQVGAALLNRLEPGLGDKVSVVANGAMQIGDAIKAFRAAQEVDFGSVVSLASGIANPALAIFTVMQATGPSADEQILGLLADISKRIAQLRQEMHQRFDVVDKKLDNIF